MAGSPRRPDTGLDTGTRPGRDSPTGMPRWVKVSGIIVAILVLLVVGMMLIPSGGHGPARHGSSADASSQAPLASLTADPMPSGDGDGGHTPPPSTHG